MIRLAHRAGRPKEKGAVTVDKSTNRLTHRNSDNSHRIEMAVQAGI